MYLFKFKKNTKISIFIYFLKSTKKLKHATHSFIPLRPNGMKINNNKKNLSWHMTMNEWIQDSMNPRLNLYEEMTADFLTKLRDKT